MKCEDNCPVKFGAFLLCVSVCEASEFYCDANYIAVMPEHSPVDRNSFFTLSQVS